MYDIEMWASLFSSEQKKPMNRVMLCLKPPQDVVDTTADQRMSLWRAAGSPSYPLRDGQLHVSVCGLGDHHEFPGRLCRRVTALLDAISFANFPVRFDRFARFGGRAAVLRGSIPNTQASSLSHEIGTLMQKRLFPPFRYRRTVDPHMTIFYGGNRFLEKAVDRVEWMADELVLVHSLIGQARHRIIATWPLRGLSRVVDSATASSPIQLDLF